MTFTLLPTAPAKTEEKPVEMPKFSSFDPKGARVLVLPYATPDKTESGLYLPKTAMQEQGSLQIPVRVGVIRAIGNGTLLQSGERAPMEYEVGQNVAYTVGAMSCSLSFDGKVHDVLNESMILGVLA